VSESFSGIPPLVRRTRGGHGVRRGWTPPKGDLSTLAWLAGGDGMRRSGRGCARGIEVATIQQMALLPRRLWRSCFESFWRFIAPWGPGPSSPTTAPRGVSDCDPVDPSRTEVRRVGQEQRQRSGGQKQGRRGDAARRFGASMIAGVWYEIGDRRRDGRRLAGRSTIGPV